VEDPKNAWDADAMAVENPVHFFAGIRRGYGVGVEIEMEVNV